MSHYDTADQYSPEDDKKIHAFLSEFYGTFGLRSYPGRVFFAPISGTYVAEDGEVRTVLKVFDPKRRWIDAFEANRDFLVYEVDHDVKVPHEATVRMNPEEEGPYIVATMLSDKSFVKHLGEINRADVVKAVTDRRKEPGMNAIKAARYGDFFVDPQVMNTVPQPGDVVRLINARGAKTDPLNSYDYYRVTITGTAEPPATGAPPGAAVKPDPGLFVRPLKREYEPVLVAVKGTKTGKSAKTTQTASQMLTGYKALTGYAWNATAVDFTPSKPSKLKPLPGIYHPISMTDGTVVYAIDEIPDYYVKHNVEREFSLREKYVNKNKLKPRVYAWGGAGPISMGGNFVNRFVSVSPPVEDDKPVRPGELVYIADGDAPSAAITNKTLYRVTVIGNGYSKDAVSPVDGGAYVRKYEDENEMDMGQSVPFRLLRRAQQRIYMGKTISFQGAVLRHDLANIVEAAKAAANGEQLSAADLDAVKQHEKWKAAVTECVKRVRKVALYTFKDPSNPSNSYEPKANPDDAYAGNEYVCAAQIMKGVTVSAAPVAAPSGSAPAAGPSVVSAGPAPVIPVVSSKAMGKSMMLDNNQSVPKLLDGVFKSDGQMWTLSLKGGSLFSVEPGKLLRNSVRPDEFRIMIVPPVYDESVKARVMSVTFRVFSDVATLAALNLPTY